MTKRIRVYISGPLHTGTTKLSEVEYNVANAVKVASALVEHGYAPLCPHFSHYIDPENKLGRDTWLSVDLPWLEISDVVYRIPGPSIGAMHEVAHADKLGIPIVRSIDELNELRDSGVLPMPCGARLPEKADRGDARYLALLQEMKELHFKKAADYGSNGDPLANLRGTQLFGVSPWMGAIIRMSDKFHRVKTFCCNGELKNESFEDSLKDLAAYALLALVLYRESSEKALTEVFGTEKACEI